MVHRLKQEEIEAITLDAVIIGEDIEEFEVFDITESGSYNNLGHIWTADESECGDFDQLVEEVSKENEALAH